MAFKRVLLKLSGEALMGGRDYGLDEDTIDKLAKELVEVRSDGLELGLVIGGGNIYRGMAAAARGMDRATGWPFRRHSSGTERTPASSRRSRCRRWRSRTSAGAPSGTSRRAGS